MKKLLFSVATFIATNFIYGQIDLEKSFAFAQYNDLINHYTNENELYYFSTNSTDKTIKIYDSSYVLVKTVNIPVMKDYYIYQPDRNLRITKKVFNTDDKFEFLVMLSSRLDLPNHFKLIVFNEDGDLIKDFNTDKNISYLGRYEIFHDPINNVNKILINQIENQKNEIFAEVYKLSTSTLNMNDIKTKNNLKAFPIPTNKVLNVVNPQNNSNVLEVYDMNGKLIKKQSFMNYENSISVDVESLPKGMYIYRVGDLSSKFLKN